MIDEQGAGARAFGFTGTWRDYAPIAFTNLLLTIVTLGIYMFWARARTRRYLWGHTRFIDDRLEWTGTGMELFVGYLIAAFFFLLPLGLINLVLQSAVMRGHPGAAGLGGFITYATVFYLFGVARFRALRYRLSRTRWHGIRGGSDRQGVAYGWSYVWRTILSFVTLYLMTPWAMVELWNARWNAMSFGSLEFRSGARWQPVFKRFVLFYIVPIVAVVVISVAAAMFVARNGGAPVTAHGAGWFFGGILIFYLVFFGLLGLIAVAFYSAFFREAVGGTTLGALEFRFDASTKDWVKFYLGTAALVVLTLGIGLIFLSYRNWAFFVRHLDAHGEVAVDTLTQSQTRDPRQGEGLLDAFDVGAF